MAQSDFEKGRKLGRDEGYRDARIEALTFLEKKYLGPDAPERNTPEAVAILDLARQMAEQMKIVAPEVSSGN